MRRAIETVKSRIDRTERRLREARLVIRRLPSRVDGTPLTESDQHAEDDAFREESTASRDYMDARRAEDDLAP